MGTTSVPAVSEEYSFSSSAWSGLDTASCRSLSKLLGALLEKSVRLLVIPAPGRWQQEEQ